MGLAFYINKYMDIILVIVLILSFAVIILCYIKYLKEEKKQNELVKNIIVCAYLDSKERKE